MRTPDFTGMPNLEDLDLMECTSLEEVHHSLEYCRKLIRLNLNECVSLVKFPCVNMESLEYLDLDGCSGLEKFPEIVGRMKPELDKHQTHSTVLYLTGLKSLVALPSSICKFKGLVKLNVWGCSKFESLPEEIGDLENLEELDAEWTLISRPPSSIVRLNKLKLLIFAKHKSEDGVFFVFPHVSEGLRSLEILDLSYCNLIDGGLLEDVGCLHSLKELNLSGNNFEHLPRSIAQLGSLQTLDLSHCNRLTQLPEFPQQLDTINADDDGMSSMTQEFSLSNHSEYTDEDTVHFLLVPLGGLWDASKANRKTPNDYGCIRLYSPQERNDFGEISDFGVRLFYKDEAELCIGIRRSRYEEASSFSFKKQRSQVQVPLLPLFPTSPGL